MESAWNDVNDEIHGITHTPKNCPTCDSPSPERHPAMQFEGEASLCRDPWHRTARNYEKHVKPYLEEMEGELSNAHLLPLSRTQ